MDELFTGFPSIYRYNREIIVTEKIDGTNAQVCVTDDGRVIAGSRTRWVTPSDDNFGFAKWVQDNIEALRTLGPGKHFGEWWGSGVQRGYGLPKGLKKFSLFNVTRFSSERPACCGVVPVLWRGLMEEFDCAAVCADLRLRGSKAAPGFMKPEGIVIFHTKSGVMFKKTLEKDESGKWDK